MKFKSKRHTQLLLLLKRVRVKKGKRENGGERTLTYAHTPIFYSLNRRRKVLKSRWQLLWLLHSANHHISQSYISQRQTAVGWVCGLMMSTTRIRKSVSNTFKRKEQLIIVYENSREMINLKSRSYYDRVMMKMMNVCILRGLLKIAFVRSFVWWFFLGCQCNASAPRAQ